MVETRPSDIRILTSELVKRINDETRRIRLAEQRLDRFEVAMDNLENTMSAYAAEMKSLIENINKNIKTLSDRIALTESAIGRIEKELAKRATKMELKQIESYMNLMSPITSNFVTKEEMQRAIEDKMQKKY
jgi:glyceraldehyde-3-phosphate dehydrogenase/erythrose-4-phosphate dehydrogenase